TFAVLRQVFLASARHEPVLAIVENLHWIDATSLEFLASLAPQLASSHLLLVVTTRPGTATDWLPAGTEAITIEGLSPAPVLDMTCALLGCAQIDETLLDLLRIKSEGNPLYMEEIVRQLQETGAIAVDDGRARMVGSAVSIPETVHDIIAARIDRLAEALK